jgi:hypothetical protein
MVAAGLMNDIAYRQLSMKTTKAILGQSLFLAFALVIPSITHRLGLNYLVAQPMHWMILFAGLAYGSFSGLILGLSIPIASFLITGMPMPAMLVLMLPELAVYGFVTGILKNKMTGFGSAAIALIAGRLIFLALFALSGKLDISVFEYAQRIWGPGFVAMILHGLNQMLHQS